MSDRVPPSAYRWWVRLTMMAGGRRRSGQWTYVGLSLLAAVICAAAVAPLDLRASTAVLLSAGAVGVLISAGWYTLSIRWVDLHGSWTHG